MNLMHNTRSASKMFKKALSYFFCTTKKIFRKRLNYPACFLSKYPRTYPLAHQVTYEILQELQGRDFSRLAPNSPGLTDYKWENYISCSLIRMLKVAELLDKLGKNLKILDVGSYFGNFSLFCSKLGHSVDAVDSYTAYGDCFDFVLKKFSENRINIYEFSDVGYDLKGIQKESYDVVLCLGVIEHVPHSPKPLMDALLWVLKTGGHLILETPNLAYLYNRRKLMKGESIYPPLQSQYFTEIPFQGHHREYTINEIRWILKENNFSDIFLDAYLYSLYALPYIYGIDLLNYIKMLTDKTSRELIIAIARKNG